MSNSFKPRYDAVIIGAALAGLSAAIELRKAGLDVLVLEQHNLPGGVATSYVRGGAEIEASLHEMCSIGTEQHPLRVRQFFKNHGVPVDWVKIPYCFRYVSPNVDINLPCGENGDFTKPIQAIAEACHDTDGSITKKLKDFFDLAHAVYESMNVLSTKKLGKLAMFLHHRQFVFTAGYTCKEIFDHFKFPEEVREILSAYWIYLGSPIRDLPFSIYAYILVDYIGYGPYIPKHTSFELSAKLERIAKNAGTNIEYKQRVDKILVEKGKVKGVRLASGETIETSRIICGAYPNTVYSSLIEPKKEIPAKAKKWVNANELGVSVFSVVLLLDKEADELGFKDYATFVAPNGMDSEKFYASGKGNEGWEYLTCVCPNVVHEDASPKGTSLYSITYLPDGSSMKDLSLEEYEEYKRTHVERFLDAESKRLGINLREHILEIIVETPLTISHYTGAYMGSIYGYRHNMHNHVAARTLQKGDDRFIDGLYFAGAHSLSGDGMAPQIDHGVSAAKDLLLDMKKGGK
ncbi:MAG: NAD(P)/FAD-dependent oxidoreductase [Bacilli bacterium]|nr:NAD(P)/FAD-dependent oxidoreductase [Bacilli bacterium]